MLHAWHKVNQKLNKNVACNNSTVRNSLALRLTNLMFDLWLLSTTGVLFATSIARTHAHTHTHTSWSSNSYVQEVCSLAVSNVITSVTATPKSKCRKLDWNRCYISTTAPRHGWSLLRGCLVVAITSSSCSSSSRSSITTTMPLPFLNHAHELRLVADWAMWRHTAATRRMRLKPHWSMWLNDVYCSLTQCTNHDQDGGADISLKTAGWNSWFLSTRLSMLG